MARAHLSSADDSDDNNNQQYHHQQAANSRTTEDQRTEDVDRGGGHDSHQSQESQPAHEAIPYHQLNNVIQRMFDFSLVISNVHRFRTLLDSSGSQPYFYFNTTLTAISLILQVFIGVGLLHNTGSDLRASRTNDLIYSAMLLLAIINVFVTAFA